MNKEDLCNRGLKEVFVFPYTNRLCSIYPTIKLRGKDEKNIVRLCS